MDKLHNIYIKTLILALLIFNLNITICFAQEDDDLYKFENYLLNQGLNKINNNNISFDLSFNDRNDFGLNGNIDSIFGIYHVKKSYIFVQNNLSLTNSKLNDMQSNGLIYRYSTNNRLYGMNYFSDIDKSVVIRNSIGFEYIDYNTDAYINIYNLDTLGYKNGYDYVIKETINNWIDVKYVNSKLSKKTHNIVMNLQLTDRFRIDIKTNYIGINYDIYNTAKSSLKHRVRKEKQICIEKKVNRK